MSSMWAVFLTSIWTPAETVGNHKNGKFQSGPPSRSFLSSAAGLSEHLNWQLSVTICSDTVREIADNIIGNLDENGYLTASNEELLPGWEIHPGRFGRCPGGGAGFRSHRRRRARFAECLLLQLHAFDPTNTLAYQVVSEHLKQVQSNQLKEIARALNRPLEVVKADAGNH